MLSLLLLRDEMLGGGIAKVDGAGDGRTCVGYGMEEGEGDGVGEGCLGAVYQSRRS